MEKIQVIGDREPSNVLLEEALKYFNEDPEKEKYLFHKYLSYTGVYREKIEGKTYYIKVSQPKTVSRGLKKRLGVKKPRALHYYDLSKKLQEIGVNVVAPDYVFIDKRKTIFRKNISFSWDFKEKYGIEGDYLLKNLLEASKDEKILDKWIYRYLEVIINMTKHHFYHQDPNFFNFFFKDEEIYMIDLDDVKDIGREDSERLANVSKSLGKALKDLNLSEKKHTEYLEYFNGKMSS